MDKNEVRFAVPGVKFYLLVIIYSRDEMLVVFDRFSVLIGTINALRCKELSNKDLEHF